MQIPLIVLAFGAILAGFIGVPEALGGSNMVSIWFENWVKSPLHVAHSTEYMLMSINIFVVFLGIVVAYLKFYNYDMKQTLKLSGIIYNKFYYLYIFTTKYTKY